MKHSFCGGPIVKTVSESCDCFESSYLGNYDVIPSQLAGYVVYEQNFITHIILMLLVKQQDCVCERYKSGVARLYFQL